MIRFGVAGYPPAFGESIYKSNRIDILKWLAELGLEALELQMTYGPRTAPETCREYRALAADTGISLSIHAAYYIVLTSDDPAKIERSKDTLKRTFDLANELGSKTVVLHPGPLYGGCAFEAKNRFIQNTIDLMDEIGQTEIGLFAETAGKCGQLGSVDEVLEISAMVPGVFPCIDFGHVHARTLGTLDNPAAIQRMMEQVRDFLRGRNNPRIHFHYTPIDFGPGGEKQHKAIEDRYPELAQRSLFDEAPGIGQSSRDGFYHPRPEPVAEALKMIDIDCTVIAETHDSQERGAMALQKAYGRIAVSA